MVEKLKNIATVRSGYSFRRRLEASENGNLSVIQMKDLSAENIVDCTDLIKTDSDHIKKNHLIKKGDLIFRSRGLSTTSAVLLDDPGNAVAAAPLFIIRIQKPDLITPEYLNWYISQPAAQAYLNAGAKGTTQKMIGINAVEEMEIHIPDIKKQRLIVELANFSARESELLEKLIIKRKQYISAILMKKAKEK